jgi:hypothetical protein
MAPNTHILFRIQFEKVGGGWISGDLIVPEIEKFRAREVYKRRIVARTENGWQWKRNTDKVKASPRRLTEAVRTRMA